MIEIKQTGMCRDCASIHLEIDWNELRNCDGTSVKVWKVKCIHQDACEEMMRKVRGEKPWT